MVRYLSVLVFSGVSLFAQSPQYTIHDLGALNNGAVTGINIRGEVIGYETQSDGRVRAFRTAPGSAINWPTDDLGALGGTITRAYGINASGQVVGESSLSSGKSRAFRTAANQSINSATDNLGTLSNADESHAYAINDSGQVTGGSGYAFLTGPNQAINPATDMLDVKLGIHTFPTKGTAINSSGHVLGEITADPPYYPTAFVAMDRTGPYALSSLIRYIWQDFTGITEQDQVAFSQNSVLSIWKNGQTSKLASCTDPCVPTGINNSLQVVGSTAKNQFLYVNGVVYDLATLLPDNSGWSMPNTSSGPSALRINDVGQIVGVATFNNETHAFRMDPILSVPAAIDKALNLLSSFHANLGRRSTGLLGTKSALESRLNDALSSWTRGNSASTRGFLNEFETMVRAQTGATLTDTQANQLIDMAEAAFDLT